MNGRPIGIDHSAVISHCEANDWDSDVILRLFPYAELGMLKAVAKMIKEQEQR